MADIQDTHEQIEMCETYVDTLAALRADINVLRLEVQRGYSHSVEMMPAAGSRVSLDAYNALERKVDNVDDMVGEQEAIAKAVIAKARESNTVKTGPVPADHLAARLSRIMDEYRVVLEELRPLVENMAREYDVSLD
jgi:hypothetical protein